MTDRTHKGETADAETEPAVAVSAPADSPNTEPKRLRGLRPARLPSLRQARLEPPREWLGRRASGDVLEIGIGAGEGIAHYAGDVRLTGIDVDPAMVEAARAEAERLDREVVVVEGDAHVLPFPAESFDTVVCHRVLCSVANEAIVVAEAMRVLRRGGTLLLVDHVESSWWPVRQAQHAVDRVLAPSTGEYRSRRPMHHVLAQGGEIVESERSRAGLMEYVAARKPSSGDDPADSRPSSSPLMRLKQP
jgi:SAM-dependent methyltransferase